MEPKVVDQELTAVAQEEKAAELLQKKAGAVLEYMVRDNAVIFDSGDSCTLSLGVADVLIDRAIVLALLSSGLIVSVYAGEVPAYIVDHEAIESAREKASTEVES